MTVHINKPGYSLAELDEDMLIKTCKLQLPYVQTGFEELVRRYEKKVFNLCRRYLAVENEAEDATQEVFMKVFHALPNFEQRSTFTTWLFSIATNHCNTLLGKRKRHQKYINDEQEAADHSEHENNLSSINALYEQDDEKNCIHGAMTHLKSDERDMLLLRFSSELSLDDIANVMGKKLSATKMRFYRTLEKFRELYKQYCT